MFVPTWILICVSLLIGFLLAFMCLLLTGAKQQAFEDMRTSHLTLQLVKAFILKYKQEDIFVPMCYLIQADDYAAIPEMSRDGVTIRMEKIL